MSSIRSPMPASSVPSAASTAAAWITVPRWRSTSVPTGARRRFQQPAQPAPGERLDLGRGQLDDPAAQRAGIGQRAERVPVPWVGAAHPGRGQPGQLGGGRLAHRHRPRRVGGGPAQLGGERGQRQPGPAGRGDLLDGDLVAGQLGQEPGRPLVGVLAARRGDDQGAPRPGHRDVEQPALLVQQLGGQRGRGRVGPGRLGPARGRLDQLVHAQQRATASAGRASCPPARRPPRPGPTPGPWPGAR